MITIDFEGLDILHALVEIETDALESELRDVSLAAAQAGVKEAQDSHPYEDRTYQLTETAHAVPVKATDGAGIAEMVWPKDYASYVDKGTSRSRPYPYTPSAEARATASLERQAEEAVEKYCERMTDK